MKTWVTLLSIVFLFTSLFSQQPEIGLEGKIIDFVDLPVEGAVVSLAYAGLRATTDANGTFAINREPVSITVNRSPANIIPRFAGNHLVFSVESKAEPVRIALYNTRGACIHVLIDKVLERGTHTIPLYTEPFRSLPASCYVLSLMQGLRSIRGTLLLTEKGTFITSGYWTSQGIVIRAKSRAQPVDTLIVEKQDVTTIQRPLETYINRDLVIRIPYVSVLPDLYEEKAQETPDYSQMDDAYGGLDGNGSFYCGPSSVSNGIMWLDDHGYDNLVPNTDDRKKDQHDLICLLGAEENYMNTARVGRAPGKWVCTGSYNYATDQGYTCKVEMQGDYDPPDNDMHLSDTINMKWALSRVVGPTAVFIHWRTHWNTLVGFDIRNSDPDLETVRLLTHDPSMPSGRTENYEAVLQSDGTYLWRGDGINAIIALTMLE